MYYNNLTGAIYVYIGVRIYMCTYMHIGGKPYHVVAPSALNNSQCKACTAADAVLQ